MMADRWAFLRRKSRPQVGFLVGSFCFIATIVTGCFLVLALPLVTDASRTYQDGLRALDTLALWERGLDAGRMLSAERGPTNSLLGEPLSGQAGWRARLDQARSATDEALAQFAAALAARPAPAFDSVATQVAALRVRLAEQRTRVDTLAALPREARPPALMSRAIDGMIAMAHPFLTINLAIGQTIGRDGSALRQMVLVTQLSADLREYAGQIGSRLIAALSYGPELSANHLEAVDQIEGRIRQIHDVIEGRLSGRPQDPDLARIRADLVRDYLQDGLGYIRAVRTNGLTPNGSGRLSAGEVTEHYVPQMRAINALRELMLSRAKVVATLDRDRASAWLFAAGAIVVTVFAILGLTGLLAHRHLIQPLVATTREVNELAADRFETTLPSRRYFGEIRAMIDAIAVLRARNLRRLQLEAEREELLRDIRHIAETDHLTGLSNRRTFDLMGRRALEGPEPVALILCDIDHFKAINDRYGHPCGDAVIREVARRLRQTMRSEDVVCRYGGEEFAVILPAIGAGSADELAESLRAAVAATAIRVESRDIAVTVSVGLACRRGDDPNRSLSALVTTADAALYRAKQDGRNRVRGPGRPPAGRRAAA